MNVRDFALGVLRDAHNARLSGDALVSALLDIVASVYANTAKGDADRYSALVDDTAKALRSNPGAPTRQMDPGRILSDDQLEAAAELVRAAIRWTNAGNRAQVLPAFDLILADLRRLRAPKT